MSVGDGRGTRGRYLAWCSAALSTVAIAGMGVSAAMAAEAPAEDLPTEMVRLADGNSGYTCTTTTEPSTTTTESSTTTTEPTSTTTEPTTTEPTTTTTTPAVTTTTERCDPPKDHGKDGKHEERGKDGGQRHHVGGKDHHTPTCTSAAPRSDPHTDPLRDLVAGLTGVGGR